MTAPSSLETLHCASCQERVDPLRAVGVRAQGDGFLYFCSAYCQGRFDSTAPEALRQAPTSGFARKRRESEPLSTSIGFDSHSLSSSLGARSAPPNPNDSELRAQEHHAPVALSPSRSVTRVDSIQGGASVSPKKLPEANSGETSALRSPTAAPSARLGSGVFRTDKPLLAAAAGLGGLGLGLLGHGGVLSAMCAGASCVLMVVSALVHGAQQPSQPSRLWNVIQSLGPLGAAAVLTYECLSNGEHSRQFTVSAATLGLSLSTAHWLMERHGHSKRTNTPEAQACNETGKGPSVHSPGDLIDVVAPCTLQEDCSIFSGNALAKRWPGASTEQCVAGQTLFSGATIESGRVQARVHWTRQDRCRSRLVSSETGHLTHRTAEIRQVDELASRWAIVAGLACGAAVAINSSDLRIGAMASCLVVTLFACSPLTRLAVGMSTARVYALLERGVFFRDGAIFDLTSRAPSVVFSATSSLLHNTPKVDKVEPLFSAMAADDLLALAAGCFTTSESTMGTALRNAVLTANLKLPPVRSAHYLPGMGVVGVSAEGKAVVVGSRTLLLSQKISVARAEPQIEAYEKLGRTVVLIAMGGHLAGLITLEDPRRQGASRAVQWLHEANIEAILVSGDSRHTCEALAQETGITHIRPEVDPNSRDETLRSLAASRSPLALIGRSSIDGNDLREIDVPVNLDSRGAPLERWPVEVASGLVEDAAWAVALCHRLRTQVQRVTRYCAGASIVCGTLVAAGGPLWLAPLGICLGALACTAHLELNRDPIRPPAP